MSPLSASCCVFGALEELRYKKKGCVCMISRPYWIEKRGRWTLNIEQSMILTDIVELLLMAEIRLTNL